MPYGPSDVFARRFSSAGIALASELQVNAFTIESQRDPAVAMRPGGEFVVTWSSGSRRPALQRCPFRAALRRQRFTPRERVPRSTPTPPTARDPPVDRGRRRWRVRGRLEVGLAQQLHERRLRAWIRRQRQRDHRRAAGKLLYRLSGLPKTALLSMILRRLPRGLARSGSGWKPFASASSAGASMRSAPGVSVEFQVNTVTQGVQLQHLPAIRADGDGDFVIAWESGDLALLGRHQRAATTLPASPRRPSSSSTPTRPDRRALLAIGMAPGGDFVIAWDQRQKKPRLTTVCSHSASRVEDARRVRHRRQRRVEPLTDGLLFLRYFFGFRGDTLINGAVASNCARCTPLLIEGYLGGLAGVTNIRKAGAEFQVNSYTAGDQRASAAAAEDGGDFVLTWHSFHDGSETGLRPALRIERLAARGRIQVNQYATGYTGRPRGGDGKRRRLRRRLAEQRAGRRRTGIFARGFSSTGAPQGVEFQVNRSTLDSQQHPTIAMNPTGDFVVAWANYAQALSRRLRATLQRGPPTGGRRVHGPSSSPLSRTQPAAAMFENGAFVVVFRATASSRAASIFGNSFRREHPRQHVHHLADAGRAATSPATSGRRLRRHLDPTGTRTAADSACSRDASTPAGWPRAASCRSAP